MMKHKITKKIITLGLAVAMLMGMATNVTAVSVTKSVQLGPTDDKMAHFEAFILGSMGWADTFIVCNNYTTPLCAYADMDVYIIDAHIFDNYREELIPGYVEYYDNVSVTDNVPGDMVADATAQVYSVGYGNVIYSIDTYHIAEAGGYRERSMLEAYAR